LFIFVVQISSREKMEANMTKALTITATVALMALAPWQWSSSQVEEVHQLDAPSPVSVERLEQG